ncbi:MAG: hypothetical protein ABSA45_06955 [Verrucomicrobiota bacterium]
MKSVFPQMTGWLGAKSWALLLPLGLTLSPLAVTGQTLSTYTNLGNIIFLGPSVIGNTVPFPPNIDATNFVNKGLVEILVAPLPYATSHTLNFTNTGEMLGAIGWEFDYGPLSSGGRGMAASFYNGNYNPSSTPVSGLIESVSGLLPNPILSIFTGYQGYLWVSATNIINKGYLAADAASEIKLAGTNVDLSRSFVQIAPIPGLGSFNGLPAITNFTPDTAIYDEYWAQTNGSRIDSGAIWNGTFAASAPFTATAPCALTILGNQIAFNPTKADSMSYPVGLLSLTVTNMDGSTTNVLIATNVIYQAAFVNVTDPNITGTIGFTPSTTLSNNFQTVSVEFQSSFGNTLFVIDTLASDPGRGLLANSVISPAALCSGKTYRPTNYIVSRVLIGAIGTPGAGVPATNFFYQTGWSNRVVTAPSAAYSCFVDNEASEPPSNPGDPTSVASSVTNLPGRIRISSANLNLNNTQIRAEGEVVVQTDHLVSSQNASVDCENLSYNLGSTNGRLHVANLALPSLPRFRGTVSMWSAVWSNTASVVTTNYMINPDGSVTNAFLTNTVQIGLAATLVDAGQLVGEVPVTVFDLLLHSTNNVGSTNNIILDDTMSVVESFYLDAQSFTLNGSLAFPGISPINPVSETPFVAMPIQNWVYTMAPALRYFTNNGSLAIANDAHFGDDGPTNYLEFVNNGIITAGAQTIDTADLQINNGVSEATISDFSVTAGTAIFSNALISAAGDIDISANTLLIDPSVLSANGMLNFTVTTNLSDGGIGSGNAFSCQNGFNLWVKPRTGDLWGTTITSTAWVMDEVDHFWAGEDRGLSGGGFTNNAALGGLVLSPQGFSAPYYPLFFFSGMGVTSNGLYVGTLDLTQLGANITNMIEIDPGLTIYYAHALIDAGAISLGTNASPEIYLDGRQFPPGTGGYLRYVKNFNAFSAASASLPLNGKLSASYLKSSGQVQFTLSGAAGRTYVVQASTNLVDWAPICTNVAPISGLLQFVDPKATNYPSRFYRTVTGP